MDNGVKSKDSNLKSVERSDDTEVKSRISKPKSVKEVDGAAAEPTRVERGRGAGTKRKQKKKGQILVEEDRVELLKMWNT